MEDRVILCNYVEISNNFIEFPGNLTTGAGIFKFEITRVLQIVGWQDHLDVKVDELLI